MYGPVIRSKHSMTKNLNEGQCKSNAKGTEYICKDQGLQMVIVIILDLIISEVIGVLKAGAGHLGHSVS